MTLGPVAVRVLAEDVARGVPRSVGACPIAIALRRGVSGGDRVEIARDAAWLWKRTRSGRLRRFIAILPREAFRFVGAFDARREPGEPRPEPPEPFNLTFRRDEKGWDDD